MRRIAWMVAALRRRSILLARGVTAGLVAVLLANLGTAVALANGPTGHGNPARVVVPAIGVTATVQNVGLADDGSMGIPDNFEDVAWYSLWAAPGAVGYAVFTGHVSNTAAPGVFYNVDELAPGNTIRVTTDDGTELVFVVQEVDTYKVENVPMARIFAPSDRPGVVLITCGGTWDPDAHLFADRVVVFAMLGAGQ